MWPDNFSPRLNCGLWWFSFCFVLPFLASYLWYIHIYVNNLVAEAHTQHVFKHNIACIRIHGYTVTLYAWEEAETMREYKIASHGETVKKRYTVGDFGEIKSTEMRESFEREKQTRVGETKRTRMYTDYQKGRLGIPIRHSSLIRRSNSNQLPLNPASVRFRVSSCRAPRPAAALLPHAWTPFGAIPWWSDLEEISGAAVWSVCLLWDSDPWSSDVGVQGSLSNTFWCHRNIIWWERICRKSQLTLRDVTW